MLSAKNKLRLLRSDSWTRMNISIECFCHKIISDKTYVNYWCSSGVNNFALKCSDNLGWWWSVRSRHVPSESWNSLHFIKPEVSLPHPQQPAICLYPEPEQSSQCSPSYYSKFHFNIILPSTPGSSEWSPSLKFLTKILYALFLSPYVLHSLTISVFLNSLHKWYFVRNIHIRILFCNFLRFKWFIYINLPNFRIPHLFNCVLHNHVHQERTAWWRPGQIWTIKQTALF